MAIKEIHLTPIFNTFQDEDVDYKIDQVNNHLWFIGVKLQRGYETSDSKWNIYAIISTGTTVDIQSYNGEFINVWDDRTTYFPDHISNSELCIEFDGVDEYINYEDNYNYDTATAFSIAVWVNPNNLAAVRVLFAKYYSPTSRGFVLRHNVDGALYLQMRASANRAHTFDTALTAGEWQLLILTYSGSANISGASVYRNAVKGNTPSSGSLAGTWLYGQDYTLGSRDTAFLYAGTMFQHTVWDKELSQAEITELYNGGAPINPKTHTASSSLISYHPLGEGDLLPIASDLQGGFDGTMVNMESDNFIGDAPSVTPVVAMSNLAIDSLAIDAIAVGTVVGNISVDDGASPIVFSLQSDHSGLFEIVGSELKVATEIAYETTYSITIRATDDNGSTLDLAIHALSLDTPAPSYVDTASMVLADTGSKNVHIPRTGAFVDLDTGFTMYAWWKSSDWDGGSKYMYEASNLFYTYKGSALSMRTFDGVGNTTTNSTASFTNDTWHLVGITYDGAGDWQYIIDGAVVANSNTRVLVSGNTNALKIGERTGFGVADWIFDELHVVNRPITQLELDSIYNAGSADYDATTLLGSALKHRYRMENSTTNYHDDIGGVHGTFNNSPSSTADVP